MANSINFEFKDKKGFEKFVTEVSDGLRFERRDKNEYPEDDTPTRVKWIKKQTLEWLVEFGGQGKAKKEIAGWKDELKDTAIQE